MNKASYIKRSKIIVTCPYCGGTTIIFDHDDEYYVFLREEKLTIECAMCYEDIKIEGC